ncbi:hypothetical protein AOQ84DRAFT_227955 [Glonium stellatum]|uniref:Uncharacterized protein n=1 Tax=Glonium stellatum TaxID=574774 RepID=A0A8E2EQQ6_9PEZI|nr:hypothetical protein AOQ84DRAFT_227955 [Glonium stellatum]
MLRPGPIYTVRTIKPLVRHLAHLKRHALHQRRFNSSGLTSTPKHTTPTSQTSSTTPPKRSLSLRPLVWSAICVALGLTSGYLVRTVVSPEPFPDPGTPADLAQLERLARDVDALDIVKILRGEGYHLHSDTPLNNSGEGKVGWRELDVKTVISDVGIQRSAGQSRNALLKTIDEKDRSMQLTRTLTEQAMAGTRGLGIQRAFWNAATRELIAVVWFGGGLSGWPGLAHGGAIATVFDEGFSRVVAGPETSLDSIPSAASLSLTYARPTQANRFYVLRASFSSPPTENSPSPPPPEPKSAKSWLPPWKDLTKKPAAPRNEPIVEISGTIEDLEGKVCVRAKAAFPASAVRADSP